MATTLAVMKLYENKKIKLDRRVSHYLKDFKTKDKNDITVRDLLLHRSGLPDWIPFWKKFVNEKNNNELDTNIFSPTQKNDFTIPVAENIFMRKNYVDTIYKMIAESPVKYKGKYVYSDLGFITLKRIVEKISNEDFENYLNKNLYNKMNLVTMKFNPLKYFSKEKIIPTEVDSSFRKQLVYGYVHDPGAALLGGVSGHAGLFSNAFDIAQIMQMLLNKGTYNGVKIFSQSTVDTFTAKQLFTRRGLCFDKPETEAGKPSPCSSSASAETFGHQGFTGTCTWADPKENLVYVFLSNRIYPTAQNTLLNKLSVRTVVQEIIYQSLRK